MRFPLKTLLLLPALAGMMLGQYLFLERHRVLEFATVRDFWTRFALDCTLMVMAAASLTACYATLRREERKALRSSVWRYLFRCAVFLAPFVAGLNVVIGVGGTPISRSAFRVFDVYAGMLAYAFDPWDLVTVGGHVVLTAIVGIISLAVCRRLDLANGQPTQSI